MKRSTLDIIQSVPINLYVSAAGDELVVFRADADIDCDGSGGNPDNDPWFQPETTLQRAGKSLDAYNEPFIVVPPIVITKTNGIVLGAFAIVENITTAEMCFADRKSVV